MDKKKSPGGPDPLVAALEQAGTEAFNPSNDQIARAEGQRKFAALVSRTGTFALIQSLNPLIKPDRVPRWLRVPLMDTLTLLPQRPDGVRATLEFVFSVHPSTTIKNSEAASAQKQGANITMEALKMASNLIAVPPTGVKPEEWYPGIAPQLLTLLEGDKGEDLAKVAAYVIGFGVLGRRQFGAPGTAGWKTFAEPMLSAVDPVLAGQGTEVKIKDEPGEGVDEIVEIRDRSVLTRAEDLATALKRLSSLLNSHPNPGLTKRLLGPLLVPLWVLSTWSSLSDGVSRRYQHPAKSLLEVYLRLSGSTENFMRLLGNLLSSGGSVGATLPWEFTMTNTAGIQVRRIGEDQAHTTSLLTKQWDELEAKANAFVELLSSVGTETDISALFLTLLKRSFTQDPKSQKGDIVFKSASEATEDPLAHIIESKVLQRMMETMPDKLVSDAKSILTLASEILAQGDSGSSSQETNVLEEDGEAVALSLLNLVVTTPNFQVSKMDSVVLASIERSLDRIRLAQKPETAHNLALLLKYRDEIEDPADQVPAPSDRQVEDRKTYQLAMQYITQTDSPPPVRSEGINLLSKLIQASSPILDIPATLVLLSSLLSEDEDYTTLRVMKLFTQIADKHAKSTINEVLEHYIDAGETANTDTRLRFGETLLQIIQRLGETFTGSVAASVGQSLLSIAGRRIHRPGTQARQEREDRLKAKQNAEAAEAWGGNVADIPDLSEAIADATEEEKARNRILAQIGGEDIRMRASALSVFSVGLETNIAGYGPDLVEASVDLSVSILTAADERGAEAGILRRAAVILILSFIKALADAKENGRRLAFGLTDASRENISGVLRYIEDTDNDELVKQHARDVLDSLESWRMIELFPSQTGQQTQARSLLEIDRGSDGLVGVAGLQLDRPSLPSLQSGPRPRIEEIE
ncbi:LOW QUALITY PROTEIN: uncharacterized protein B0I36DRAFT_370993 [Microdochium trichocladiopsis]|uniref:RNA polymerase II assembly factor RTP1 n=1 Tax=Microdochium trichocladiopsis TaxID=1682393 RepID=A0A9P8YH74_9PEZI|nr:LOW QUALITY PROTEIN: uncharacterized protein B0I36DRAFT_370993 [Microdochium trichocladiopsis]KAH7040220.1 LOW QUALITY PROTEIN: hypothetical protein B0I36DRAFT_370993 [Microdochium trichocladiopsis]